MGSEIISIRAFAKMVNLSDTMIHKAIKLGKITLTQVGTRKGIIYELGLKELQEFAIGASKNIDTTNIPGIKISKKTAPTRASSNRSSNGGFNAFEDVPLFVDSKSRKEFYNSELARIELEEREGRLVQKDAVYMELFEVGSILKNNILAIPSRITDQIVSLSNDRNAVFNLLTDSLMGALETLSKYDPETDK